MSLYIDNKFVRLISSRLRNFKQKKSDLYNFSCPICGDSQRNKLKARGYIFKKGNDLFYSCHNCGVGMNVGNFIKHVDPSLYKEYILERYTAGETGRGKSLITSINPVVNFTSSRPLFGKREKTKSYDFAEWVSDLPEENVCKNYVINRKIPISFHEKLLYTSHYKQFLDALIPEHGKNVNDDSRLVIPFYNEKNELIAVSGRALESSIEKLRYVTVRTDTSKEKLIYGIERLDKSKPVKIVEGPIDSMFLDNCVASGDSSLMITCNTLGVEDAVLIYDNECRNKEIVKAIGDAIKKGFKVVIWPDNIQEKDINDMIRFSGMSVEDVEKTIAVNTFSGLEALTRFTFWKRV